MRNSNSAIGSTESTTDCGEPPAIHGENTAAEKVELEAELEGFGEIAELRAAQSVRMSTEHQRYSTHNQSDKIRQNAEMRGIKTIKPYADDGKSGPSIDGRKARQRMIGNVISGAAYFNMILVYDIRHWGRVRVENKSANRTPPREYGLAYVEPSKRSSSAGTAPKAMKISLKS